MFCFSRCHTSSSEWRWPPPTLTQPWRTGVMESIPVSKCWTTFLSLACRKLLWSQWVVGPEETAASKAVLSPHTACIHNLLPPSLPLLPPAISTSNSLHWPHRYCEQKGLTASTQPKSPRWHKADVSCCSLQWILFSVCAPALPKERNSWVKPVWRITKIQKEMKNAKVSLECPSQKALSAWFSQLIFLFKLWDIPFQELNAHRFQVLFLFLSPQTITLSPRHVWEIYACLCLASLPSHGLMNSVSSNSPTLCTSGLYE